LIAATHAPSARTLSLTVLVWAGLNAFLPNDSGVDPRWLALLITVPQLLTVGLALWVLRERPRQQPVFKISLEPIASPAAP
jgi:hypothetical protein